MIRRIKNYIWRKFIASPKDLAEAEFSWQLKSKGVNLYGDISLIKLGKNVNISGGVSLYALAPIEIGDNTMVAINAIFHTSTHNYNLNPMWLERIDKPIKVGRDVWIGTGAIILPGIIIDDFSVIGAGTVVTKNVPKGAIVVGNPGRVIKYRDAIETLEKSEVDSSSYIGYEEIIKGDYNKSWLD